MADRTSRAVAAYEDVVAVEHVAPGMVRVVTWSDAYVIDVRERRCECPDMEYHLEGEGNCKHVWAALAATNQVHAPGPRLDRSLTGGEPEIVADGGAWVVVDHDNDNRREAESRSEAEDMADTAREFGSDDVEILPPGGASDDGPETDGGTADVEVVDQPNPDPETVPESADDALPERSVADDPLNWVPGEFVDEIDGAQAINRKGFEVLSHFYDVDVSVGLQVPPEETDFQFCRVKATATTEDGRECQAFGSAHVDRGDDAELLLEMADTRARKRALSIATGVGAVAVAELKNEVSGQ